MTVDTNINQTRVDVENLMKGETVDNSTVEVEARNLHNALVNALLFQPEKLDYAPELLHSIYLRYDHAKRSLTAYSTDRYTIIAVLVEVMNRDSGQNWDAVIPAESAKQIIAILKQWKRTPGPHVTLSLSAGRSEHDPQRLTVLQGDMSLYTCDLTPGEYPKLAPLFQLEDNRGGPKFSHNPSGYDGLHTFAGFNQKFLNRITRVKDQRVTPSKQDKITYTGLAKAASKLVFWVGDWAVGLVMPTLHKSEHPGGKLPSWV